MKPDKPANYFKAFIRYFIRYLRWKKVKILNLSKEITVGRNFSIGKKSEIYIPDFFNAGDNISIGSNFISQVNIHIGDECLISSNVSLIGNDHDVINSKSAYFSGRNKPQCIYLEGNNFIGFGSTLLGNITIGKNSIVGASTFVNKSVPENSIVVGIPGKVIGKRKGFG